MTPSDDWNIETGTNKIHVFTRKWKHIGLVMNSNHFKKVEVVLRWNPRNVWIAIEQLNSNTSSKKQMILKMYFIIGPYQRLK